MRIFPLQGGSEPYVFLRTPYTEQEGIFSPDDKWIAYETDEMGRMEVFVRPFPVREGKWRISTDGGRRPRWRNDGRELYFQSAGNTVMAAEIKMERDRLEVVQVQPLFQLPGANTELLDVSGNGQEFLVLVPLAEAGKTPLSLITNWLEEHKKR